MEKVKLLLQEKRKRRGKSGLSRHKVLSSVFLIILSLTEPSLTEISLIKTPSSEAPLFKIKNKSISNHGFSCIQYKELSQIMTIAIKKVRFSTLIAIPIKNHNPPLIAHALAFWVRDIDYFDLNSDLPSIEIKDNH